MAFALVFLLLVAFCKAEVMTQPEEITVSTYVLDHILKCREKYSCEQSTALDRPSKRRENFDMVDLADLKSQLRTQSVGEKMIERILASVESEGHSTDKAGRQSQEKCTQVTVNVPPQKIEGVQEQLRLVIQQNNHMLLEQVNSLFRLRFEALEKNFLRKLEEIQRKLEQPPKFEEKTEAPEPPKAPEPPSPQPAAPEPHPAPSSARSFPPTTFSRRQRPFAGSRPRALGAGRPFAKRRNALRRHRIAVKDNKIKEEKNVVSVENEVKKDFPIPLEKKEELEEEEVEVETATEPTDVELMESPNEIGEEIKEENTTVEKKKEEVPNETEAKRNRQENRNRLRLLFDRRQRFRNGAARRRQPPA